MRYSEVVDSGIFEVVFFGKGRIEGCKGDGLASGAVRVSKSWWGEVESDAGPEVAGSQFVAGGMGHCLIVLSIMF